MTDEIFFPHLVSAKLARLRKEVEFLEAENSELRRQLDELRAFLPDPVEDTPPL